MSRLLVAFMLLAPVLSSAREVGGVELPDTLQVEGKTLRLNGAGIRKKSVVKVYVAGLYLPAPTSSAAELLGADQIRMVRMIFLRGVDKEKILHAYQEGFEKNSRAELGQLQPGLDQLRAKLGGMGKGQEMTMVYLPGRGTTITQAGGASVTIPGKQFADALLRNWIGPEPADGDLKNALLGGSSAHR